MEPVVTEGLTNEIEKILEWEIKHIVSNPCKMTPKCK